MSESAYSVNMPRTTAPEPLRLRVIDTDRLIDAMERPARRQPWTVRELAPILGCSIGTLSHMRTGGRNTFPAELARRFAEAVGCDVAFLFEPALSTESDTATAVGA